MTGREILEKVFKLSLKKGNYWKQLEPLDVRGEIDRKKMIDCIILICEALDEVPQVTKKVKRDKPEISPRSYEAEVHNES